MKNKTKYRDIHRWIESQKGKPHHCENCKRSDLSHRQYHWANISKKYKKELSDWMRLCAKCHSHYDRYNNFNVMTNHKWYIGIMLEEKTAKKLRKLKPKKMTMTEFVESLISSLP